MVKKDEQRQTQTEKERARYQPNLEEQHHSRHIGKQSSQAAREEDFRT